MTLDLEKLGNPVIHDDDLHELLDNTGLMNKTLASVNSESKMLAYCKTHLFNISFREIKLDMSKALKPNNGAVANVNATVG